MSFLVILGWIVLAIICLPVILLLSPILIGIGLKLFVLGLAVFVVIWVLKYTGVIALGMLVL